MIRKREIYIVRRQINISQTTFQQVNQIFEIEERGSIASGKKGDVPMYFLNRIKPEFSAGSSGFKSNDMFQKKFGQMMKIYNP